MADDHRCIPVPPEYFHCTGDCDCPVIVCEDGTCKTCGGDTEIRQRTEWSQPSQFITIAQAAERSGRTVNAIRIAVNACRIRHRRADGVLLVETASLDEWARPDKLTGWRQYQSRAYARRARP